MDKTKTDEVKEVARRIQNLLTLTSSARSEKIDKIIGTYRGDEGADPRKHWYYHSYPCFRKSIDRFIDRLDAQEQSRSPDPNETEQFFVQLVANIWSWIPGIPKAETQDTENLRALCDRMRELRPWAIADVTKVTTNKRGHAVLYRDEKSLDLNEYMRAINKLLNGRYSGQSRIPTVTKYLHFVHPQLFPILDRKVYATVFDKTEASKGFISEMAYRIYVQALVELFKEDETHRKLNLLRTDLHTAMQRFDPDPAEGVSDLRLIDMLLF